jgi:hypothetical protein
MRTSGDAACDCQHGDQHRHSRIAKTCASRLCKPQRSLPDERVQAQHVMLDRSHLVPSSSDDTVPTSFVMHASVSLQCTSIAMCAWSDLTSPTGYHPDG